MRTLWTRCAVALVVAGAAARADAIPAFARKYGMACSACHLGWPVFNQMGQHFRDEGYQFGLEKDDPVTVAPGYVPFAIRATAAYQLSHLTNQPSDAGPITVTQGGVPLPPGVDVLTAGTLTRDISFLAVISGFGEDGTASMESYWARLDHLLGTPWLNLKIGKFELDEPASAHRPASLLSAYGGYGAHPEGSVVPFDMGENQVGVELDGHDGRSALRYAISFTSVNGGEGLSGNGWSAPMVYAHVQRAFELDSAVLPWVRLGVLGGVGWWPTAFQTDGGEPIPGTGTDHKTFSRAGVDLSWYLGNPATPAFFTVAWIHGEEDRGLASGVTADGLDLATVSNGFDGGFVEVDWVPFTTTDYVGTPWMFFAKYDLQRYRHGSGALDAGTVGVRRYLILGPRASAALHLEGYVDRTKGVGAPDPVSGTPRTVETQAVLLGIDFDY